MSSTHERPERAAQAAPSGAPEENGPIVRDNRVIDPLTGEVRRPSGAGATGADATGADATGAGSPGAGAGDTDARSGGAGDADAAPGGAGPAAGAGDGGEPSAQADPALAAAQALAGERLADLQRLNAEYTNYRKRVDRDRAVDYARGVSDVIDALIPVLDDLHAARQHGELGGPFAAIADKLEAVLGQRFGVERYGATGEGFDPAVHEALMHATSSAVEESSVSQVLQPGYRVGERILRAARVSVVSPE